MPNSIPCPDCGHTGGPQSDERLCLCRCHQRFTSNNIDPITQERTVPINTAALALLTAAARVVVDSAPENQRATISHTMLHVAISKAEEALEELMHQNAPEEDKRAYCRFGTIGECIQNKHKYRLPPCTLRHEYTDG